MCLLLESIRIVNRVFQNLDAHTARLNRSRMELFGSSDKIELGKILKVPNSLTEGIYKCRIIYAETIQGIEFVPYIPRIVRSLELVDGGNVEYEHKYLDKTQIDRLTAGKKADDILIVKEGSVTDTSFSNVVFFDGVSWITPARPLLKGTKRQLLINTGRIREEEIKTSDLKYFQKTVLVNAMLDFDVNNFIAAQNIFNTEHFIKV
jgi:4-amino-4-deoxychorismate lyase